MEDSIVNTPSDAVNKKRSKKSNKKKSVKISEANVESPTIIERPSEPVLSEELVSSSDESPTEELTTEELPTEKSPILESLPEEPNEIHITDTLEINEETIPKTPIVEEPPIEETPIVPTIPKMVFIIPYRNRESHLRFFINHMTTLLEDIPKEDYEFYIIHQDDTRTFNRGAIKNIGFLYVKTKYPKDYLHMTLVFNDVDTMPERKNYIDYRTRHGMIKHFCGFVYTLGGIVSITGADFERVNGYPNFWAWGFEDNTLYQRAIRSKIHVDRSNFCDFYLDKKLTHFISLSSGATRTVNKNEYIRYMSYTREGIQSIRNIKIDVDNRAILSDIPTDALNIRVVNVQYFDTGVPVPTTGNEEHDLRKGTTPFGKVMYRRNGSFPRINMNM
jgi:hypothetical protein